jgi:hypothetical protein
MRARVDLRKRRGCFCKTVDATRPRAVAPRVRGALSCAQSAVGFKEPDFDRCMAVRSQLSDGKDTASFDMLVQMRRTESEPQPSRPSTDRVQHVCMSMTEAAVRHLWKRAVQRMFRV